MRIAIIMAHYFQELANSNIAAGSTLQGMERKINAVTETLHALKLLSQKGTYVTNCSDYIVPINSNCINDVDIFVCTIGEQHILNKLPIPRHYFNRVGFSKVEPTSLTFICQIVLRDLYLKNQDYDFYCYIDDDIVIRDLSFFQKLMWLNKQLDNENILIMPSCYEISRNIYDADFKLYINHEDTDKYNVRRFQNFAENNNFSLEWQGIPIEFSKPYNPYSASYFLSNKQMKKVVSEGKFDQMISFSDILESGVMTNILDKFIIYKPSLANASFLEVEHYGNAYLKMALHCVLANRRIVTPGRNIST